MIDYLPWLSFWITSLVSRLGVSLPTWLNLSVKVTSLSLGSYLTLKRKKQRCPKHKINLFLLGITLLYIGWSACTWSYARALQFLLVYNGRYYHIHHSYWGLLIVVISSLLTKTRLRKRKFLMIGLFLTGLLLIINHLVMEGFILSPTLF